MEKITREYEVFGILDNKRKDIFTEKDIKDFIGKLSKETSTEILKDILKDEQKYIDIQKDNITKITGKKNTMTTYILTI